MFSSLRWKMVAGQTLLLSLLLGLSLILAYNGVKMMHVARSANLLRQSVSAVLMKKPLMMEGVILPGGVAIIDEGGNVVVGFFDTKREGFDSFLKTVLSTKNVGFAKLGEEEYLVVVVEKAMAARGPEKYYLLQPAGGITVLLNLLSRAFVFLWLAFTGVSFAIGYYFVSETLSPMKRITKEVRQITATDLSKRVYEPETNDEVSLLAKTLNNMLSRLQTGFEAQSEFLNDVSHELRTPLTTIQGYSELITKFCDKADIVKESGNAIRETTLKLHRLVETLLALSKPVTKVNLHRVDLREFLERIALEFRKDFKDFQIDVEGSGTACVDEDVLEIILKALVENAVKFSKENKRIVLKGYDGKVIVKDFGVGISAEERERIFRRFYKSDKSRSSQGHGLGLSLVMRLVNALDGTIDVDSEPGKGTEFIIAFPVDCGKRKES